MKKTYAPNSIIIGFLIGMLVWATVDPVLGVVAGIGVSVVGWIAIRMLEKLIDKGVNAAETAITNAAGKRKENR